MIIHGSRDSICYGDDCTAPNARDLECEDDMTLSGLLEKAAEYVPHYWHEQAWVVTRGNNKNSKKNMVLGFVVFDDSDNHYCELAVPDGNVQTIGIDKIFCRYFYRRTPIWRDERRDGHTIFYLEELYPQCGQLIDMVKAELRYEKSKTV